MHQFDSATQRDRNVTLGERDGIGGTCLNYGCVPSKALVTASNLVTEIESVPAIGVSDALEDGRDALTEADTHRR